MLDLDNLLRQGLSSQGPEEILPLKDVVAQPVSLADNVKDSNPKDAIGITKAPISTVSFPVMAELGVAMLEGALKYGKHNYREIGVRASVYLDACINRHLGAWIEGQDTDPDSGLSHLVKAIACLMIMRDAQMRGKLVDDRPVGTAGHIEHLNSMVKDLLARYPEPAEPFIAHKKDGSVLEPDTYLPSE